MPAPRWYIDASDPSAVGIYSSANGQQGPGALTFFLRDKLPREIQLVRKSRDTNQPFELVDPTGGSLKVCIGNALDVTTPSPYVGPGSWSISTPPAGSTSIITAGTATQNAVLSVTLGADSTGGSFQLTVGRPQIYTASIPANTAIKANGTITCADGSALQSKFFDLPGASSAIVRFWYNQSGLGTAPATPAGGSVSAITTTVSGDTSLTVAALTSAAIEAHADFTSTAVGGAIISWAAAAYGTKTTVANAGDSGHGIATVSQGNNGQLDQKSFQVNDEDGTVAVWFDASSAGATGYPASAAAARRQIRVVIAAADTGTTAATAAATAIDADGKFNNTTSSAGTVTIGLTNNGLLADGDDDGMSGVSGFSLTTSTEGYAATGLFPWGAEADDLETAFLNAFTVTKSSLNSWRLTATAKGAYAAPTLVESGLNQAKYFTGVLDCTVANALAYFAASPAENVLSAYLEIQYTDAGAFPATVLHVPCSFVRDVIV